MADEMEYVKLPTEEPSLTWDNWDNPQILGVVVAVIAVLISLIVFAFYRRRRSQKTGVLLLGLSDSGKTLIFARLVNGRFVDTHTSVKENTGEYLAGSNVLKIIDIPGHERLRGRYFDRYKASARGLVYVIDSLSIQKDVKDAAEFLYNCLGDSVIMKNAPSVLILCNKQDETLAKGSNVIKVMLEREMDLLRKTKTRQLQSIESTSDNVFLGKEGVNFEFSQLSPIKIDFAESSAITEDDEEGVNNDDGHNLNSLEDWIHTLT